MRIPFWINATPPARTSLTEDDIEGAILSAARTWTGASPRICFVYEGRTTREPVRGDGFSVFAYGDRVQTSTDDEAYIVEANIMRTVPLGLTSRWTPCEQRDGSCTPTGEGAEIEDLLAHEMGHVLGLGHPPCEEDPALLTMCPFMPEEPGDRHKVTLALGDVLGIRHLYPCDCPLPPIYDP